MTGHEEVAVTAVQCCAAAACLSTWCWAVGSRWGERARRRARRRGIVAIAAWILFALSMVWAVIAL